jgi:hypothetical protein
VTCDDHTTIRVMMVTPVAIMMAGGQTDTGVWVGCAPARLGAVERAGVAEAVEHAAAEAAAEAAASQQREEAREVLRAEMEEVAEWKARR